MKVFIFVSACLALVNAQSTSDQGGSTPDIGGFFKGISDGIGSIIGDFAKPIQTFGKTLCFAIDQGINQAVRLDDFIGQTFSISINGTPVYNGTITGGNNTTSRHGHKRLIKDYVDKLKGDKGDSKDDSKDSKDDDKDDHKDDDKGGYHDGHDGHYGHHKRGQYHKKHANKHA